MLVSLPDLTGATLIDTLGQGGSQATVYGVGVLAMLALPAVIGVFWGAPLVARELENGTHRLVWTQSISRTRWLATRVGLVGLFALAGAAAVTALVSWWCGPIDDALNAGATSGSGFLEQTRMQPVIFAARGIVPIAYTAFAFALGVTAGTVLRRTVPAMALTLVVFVAVGLAAPKVRAQLGATERTTAITAENLRGLGVSGITSTGAPMGPVDFVTISIDAPGAWQIANETVRSGAVQDTLPQWVAGCVPAREFAAAWHQIRPGVLRPPRPRGLPAARRLHAREPLLDAAVDRDGRVLRARRPAARRLLLVDSPPRVLTTPTAGPMRRRSSPH